MLTQGMNSTHASTSFSFASSGSASTSGPPRNASRSSCERYEVTLEHRGSEIARQQYPKQYLASSARWQRHLLSNHPISTHQLSDERTIKTAFGIPRGFTATWPFAASLDDVEAVGASCAGSLADMMIGDKLMLRNNKHKLMTTRIL